MPSIRTLGSYPMMILIQQTVCFHSTYVETSTLFLQGAATNVAISYSFLPFMLCFQDFPGGSDGKASACNAGDLGSIPGSGRSSGEGNGNPLQYSCLENPMDRGAWQATLHGVEKSRTQLSNFTSLSSLYAKCQTKGLHELSCSILKPLAKYGCENWTTKKSECQRIDAFELWCWKRLLRVPWTARRSNQSILKEISPEYSLEGLMLKLKLQYFGHLMRRTNSLEKTLMLEKIEGGRRRE